MGISGRLLCSAAVTSRGVLEMERDALLGQLQEPDGGSGEEGTIELQVNTCSQWVASSHW